MSGVITYHRKVEDTVLGTVYIRVHRCAVRLIWKVIDGSVFVTVPPYFTDAMLRPYILQQRDTLYQLLQQYVARKEERVITPHFQIRTDHFRFFISYPAFGQFRIRERMDDTDGIHTTELQLPDHFSFTDHQRWLESKIVHAVERFAYPYLQRLMESLSKQTGISYGLFDVGHARSRWGVCTKKRIAPDVTVNSIIISAYTALLPDHLTKFILLHELTHILHPDHSPAFHQDLNQFVLQILNRTEKECDRQVNAYHTNIFSFAVSAQAKEESALPLE